ncbi:ABC transporter permease, partial [Myxococcota bacterium]
NASKAGNVPDAGRAAGTRRAPATSGYWRLVWGQFRRRRTNRAALGVVLALAALALVADFLAASQPILLSFRGRFYFLPNVFFYPGLQIYDNALLQRVMGPGDWAVLPLVPWGYNNHDLCSVLVGPSSLHWLGTDTSGRDVAARVIHGSRVSLGVGVLASLVSTGIGIAVGSVAGYYGGRLDGMLMRVVEVVNSLPGLLILVTMLSILAPEGWGSVLSMSFVIGLVGWTTVARLMRGEILRVKTLDFVQASRAQGASNLRVIAVHVIPNSMSPVLVAATFSMAHAVLLEGGLSFLGFGIPSDMASWGGLLKQGYGNWEAWWLTAFPGLAVFVAVLVYNLAGEGLRDAMDPRLKRV